MRKVERMALAALNIAAAFVPVVHLVGGADPEPDRIGKIDAAHPARESRLLINTVGRERVGAVGKNLAAPANSVKGTTLLRRILRVEFFEHDAERGGRQSFFQRAARLVDEENVVPFLDTWRRHQDLAHDSDSDNYDRGEPACRAQRYRSGKDKDGRHEH